MTLNDDRTQCIAPVNTKCNPTGFFGDDCKQCSSVCRTCTGPTSSDCATCADGTYFLGNSCVKADTNGICEGSGGLVADNVRSLCTRAYPTFKETLSLTYFCSLWIKVHIMRDPRIHSRINLEQPSLHCMYSWLLSIRWQVHRQVSHWNLHRQRWIYLYP